MSEQEAYLLAAAIKAFSTWDVQAVGYRSDAPGVWYVIALRNGETVHFASPKQWYERIQSETVVHQ